MDVAHLILEYLQVLIWPLIVVLLIFKYGKHLSRLLDRIARESEEISSSFLRPDSQV